MFSLSEHLFRNDPSKHIIPSLYCAIDALYYYWHFVVIIDIDYS